MPFTDRVERQSRRLERREKYRGSGWFFQSPARYRDNVQSHTYRIVKVYGRETAGFQPGSFAIEIGQPERGSFGGFTVSHPADIQEILEIAGVEKPEGLLGKEVIWYWREESFQGEPRPGTLVLGFDLLVREELDTEKCRSLHPSYLPALVLATNKRYNFREREKWMAIEHKTAGVRCHLHHMMGRVLRPGRGVLDGMRRLSYGWLETGAAGVNLDRINEYRRHLNEILGVDCNESYGDFEEAIYPIDCSPETIRALAADDVPDDLDDLIVHPDIPLPHAYWKLYILGPNSD